MTTKEKSEKLITPSRYHRTLDGTVLAAMREEAGLTQAEFAKKCGWSQQFQSQIEAPKVHEISTLKAETVQNILVALSQNQLISNGL